MWCHLRVSVRSSLQLQPTRCPPDSWPLRQESWWSCSNTGQSMNIKQNQEWFLNVSVGFSRPPGLFLGCIGKIICKYTDIIYAYIIYKQHNYWCCFPSTAFDLCRTWQDCTTMSDVFQWKPRVLLQIEASWAQQLLSRLCVTYSGTHFGPGLGIFWFLQFLGKCWKRWKTACKPAQWLRVMYLWLQVHFGQPTDQVGGFLGAQILRLCWSQAESGISACLILALFWLEWPMTTWPADTQRPCHVCIPNT